MTNFPRPTGELMGEGAGSMPAKGTGTAVPDTYGKATEQDATNREGSAKDKTPGLMTNTPERQPK